MTRRAVFGRFSSVAMVSPYSTAFQCPPTVDRRGKKTGPSRPHAYMSLGEAILGATVDDKAFEFEAAVAPEANRLFGLALTITGDTGQAEDAVQETMFSA